MKIQLYKFKFISYTSFNIQIKKKTYFNTL